MHTGVPTHPPKLLTRRERHYTDDPAFLRAAEGEGVLRIEGAGFVTTGMMAEALRPFQEERSIPGQVLIDLREVSGYEARCVDAAIEWLGRARPLGVERIAFVARSAIVRTATDVASQRAGVSLRTFGHGATAQRWLCGRAPDTVPTKPVRPRLSPRG